MTTSLLQILRRIWTWFNPELRTTHVEELPDRLRPNLLYLVGEAGNHWCMAFLCPCGCGDPIHLNLVPETRPAWRIRKHWNASLTVQPSVWRTKGCRSHFWIRRSCIVWCGHGH